jgi:hypothetical protein
VSDAEYSLLDMEQMQGRFEAFLGENRKRIDQIKNKMKE